MNDAARPRPRPAHISRTGPSARQHRARNVLMTLELGTGGSALLCGGLLALRPDGSLLGLPTRVLVDGPFADWRLPGLLLAGFVGVGLLVAGAWERWHAPHSRELSVVAGVGLVAFEAVEWGWLGFHPLQAVFMAVGASVAALALSLTAPSSLSDPVDDADVAELDRIEVRR